MEIAAYPAFRREELNPLNAILYRHLAASARVREFRLGERPRRTTDIVHIHWPDLPLSEPNPAHAALKSWLILHRLGQARALGARVVWTVHNLAPHEPPWRKLADWYRPRLLQRLDGLIFLTASSRLAALTAMPQLVGRPSAVIRRGNFRPILGDLPARPAARAVLGLPPDRFVFLNFGQIRPYKNVPELVREFVALDCPTAFLAVAGAVRRDDRLGPLIESLVAGRADVRLDLRFIPDETLKLYLAAADMVVLPYRDILNSAGLLMALSAARPVVCPRLGGIAEIAAEVGRGWIHAYDGDFHRDHLRAAMAVPPPQSRPDLSRFDWDLIARQHLEFFTRLATDPSRV